MKKHHFKYLTISITIVSITQYYFFHCKAIQRNPVSTKNLKKLNYNTDTKKRSFPHLQLDYKTKQIQSMYDAEEEENITPSSVESTSCHLWRYASSQRSPECFSDLRKKTRTCTFSSYLCFVRLKTVSQRVSSCQEMICYCYYWIYLKTSAMPCHIVFTW